MLISELAQASGVPVSTLRFYERRGVLAAPERTSAGYREYAPDTVERVRYLRRGQELGFTLAELAELASLTSARPGGDGGERLTGPVPLTGDVAARGTAKLAEIDARIADLVRVRAALAGLLAAQCVEPDSPCPVVAALGGTG